MSSKQLSVDADLEKLQQESFNYFLYETNPANGLVIDKTAADWPSSIAATGLALAAYTVGVERGFMSRSAAVERTINTLRFFWNSPQGPERDATGYKGFYYHFLDMQTGRRAWEWASTYRWEKCYGYEYLYAGPLFTHQLSHVWIDFRGIQDDFMRVKGIDYFENSRRATYVQQKYAIDNPFKFAAYGPHCWGLTASEGPGSETINVGGVERNFFDYIGRGVPYGPDDGTMAPWAVVASLPFAPEIVLPTLSYCIHQAKLTEHSPYGFKASFNTSYPGKTYYSFGWVSRWHYGINQGPIILMIENYRSGLMWRLMRNCPYIVEGLRRADFIGGWLCKWENRPPLHPLTFYDINDQIDKRKDHEESN